jgi:hypothetical protein
MWFRKRHAKDKAITASALEQIYTLSRVYDNILTYRRRHKATVSKSRTCDTQRWEAEGAANALRRVLSVLKAQHIVRPVTYQVRMRNEATPIVVSGVTDSHVDLVNSDGMVWMTGDNDVLLFNSRSYDVLWVRQVDNA